MRELKMKKRADLGQNCQKIQNQIFETYDSSQKLAYSQSRKDLKVYGAKICFLAGWNG